MELTPEQRAAVACDDNLLLEACPGSGKTRAIVARILHCLDSVRDTTRKIAVLTYTNAAVYEIETRLRIYGASGDLDSCEISTLHSFCLNNILRPFCWRCPEYATGFTLLTSDAEAFQTIVAEVMATHGLHQRAAEEFERLNRNAAGEPVLRRTALVTAAAAHDFWRKLQEQGAIDFSTIIFLTHRLLAENPSLARMLSCRFRWILVDEFQDTTELQLEILQRIYAVGESRFFLVGDPHQSIYGFAGVEPERGEAFAQAIGARRDFQLSQNWRSNPPIITHAERLRPRPTPMVSAGAIAADTTVPVYACCATPYEAIEEYFLPALDAYGIEYGQAAVLAPWWITLLHVGRSLRATGIPIIGPGSRPYRGSLLLARFAEYACEYIERPDPALIRNLQRELQVIIAETSEGRQPDAFGHSGRTTIYRLLRIGTALREASPSAQRWLKGAAAGFAAQLINDGFLPESSRHLLVDSAATMLAQIARNGVDLANLTVSDLGFFAATDRSLRLQTIHAAKGLEYEAVALLGLNDGQMPHFSAQSDAEVDEQRRLFYVGITRAKRFLLYVSDTSNPRNTPSRFLGPRELRLW